MRTVQATAGVRLDQSPGNSCRFENSSVAIFKTQTQSLGNLFNGNEASARLDYNWNASNRMFAQFQLVPLDRYIWSLRLACTRGFTNPIQELLSRMGS